MRERTTRRAGGFVLRALVVVATLAAGPIAASAKPPAGSVVVADGPLARWSFYNGAEFPGATGSLVWNATEGARAPGCAEVRFSFAGGGNYVAATIPLPADRAVRCVRLMLRKPGTNRITFRGTDHTGQSFQKYVDYRDPGWQAIEVDLSNWVYSFGGPADGRVRWPMESLGVLIEKDGDAREGAYFIDDVEYLADAGATRPGVRESTYAAATFAPDDGWSLEAPAGCSLEANTLTFDLPQPGAAAVLRTERSLLGRPTRLRLRVESDGPGLEVFVSLYSHFQTFERSLGVLDKTGPCTLEAPLGAMDGWTHSGGENDGVVRLPLRLARVRFVRRGETQRGRVRLLGLDVETEYTPEQFVVVIPDGRVDGATAQFAVALRNLAAQPVSGTLAFEARGTVGRVAVDDIQMTLPAGAVPVRRTMTVPMAGRRFVEGAFRFIGPGGRTPETSITVVRPPEGAPQRDEDSPIGVGLYLYRHQWRDDAGRRAALARMDLLASMAAAAGVKWSREEIQWHVTEPRRGEFDWTFYDELVRTADRYGIRIYGLLAYWSWFTEREKTSYTEAGIHEYARWAAAVVRRYKSSIKHWEIWNEPNIFFWSGPKPLYGELLREAYAAIKKEDPDAQVLGCSTSGIDVSFIQGVLKWNAPFDILTVHPYRGGLDDLGFIDELHRTRALVGRRPVWITEMGWPACIGGTSERRQAGLVARSYLSAIASDAVGNVSWYDFRDDGDDPFYNEARFGLVRTDMRPKAGYLALATLGRALAGRRSASAVPLGDGVVAFRFAGPGDDVIALWSPDEDRTIAVSATGTVRRAYDAMSQPVSITAGRPSVLTLPADFPVYVVGAAGLSLRREEPPVRVVVEPPVARPGEVVRVRVEGAALSVTWQWPSGWTAESDARSTTADSQPAAAARSWMLRVPPGEPPGRVGWTAELRIEGAPEPVLVPASVQVQPEVLRL